MRSAGNFNSEWGYLAPAPSFMRTVRVVLVATAIGATAGAAVVLSLIDRPPAEHDNNTASITAHAIVTSVKAAPATATLAAPVGVTTAVPAAVAATVHAQSPAPVMQQVTATVTPPQVAMQPPPVVTSPAANAPQATPITAQPAAVPPQAPSAQLQESVAVSPLPENSAESGASAAAASKGASGFASLSDGRSATEAAPAEAPDQALIPPQTVPPVKKPRPHAAYASNNRYYPSVGLGTVLRRLFSPHNGRSYYPNR